MALIAGGLAVLQLVPELGFSGGREILGAALIALGTLLSVGSMWRWASAGEAIRQDKPIPFTRLPLVLAYGVVIVTGIVWLLVIIDL